MNIWLVFILAGLITYATRLSFILLIGRRPIPLLLWRVLRFIPPAVLTAIIFPELFLHDGALNVSPGNARLLAGVLAALIAWRTRSAVLTVVVGMLALWLIEWLMPLLAAIH
jgi:branched-subunit amino acid transport protein